MSTLIEAMEELNFGSILKALDKIPLRESQNLQDRLHEARVVLSDALGDLWKIWLRKTSFRSPLLIFDEAHHLKNLTQLSS